MFLANTVTQSESASPKLDVKHLMDWHFRADATTLRREEKRAALRLKALAQPPPSYPSLAPSQSTQTPLRGERLNLSSPKVPSFGKRKIRSLYTTPSYFIVWLHLQKLGRTGPQIEEMGYPLWTRPIGKETAPLLYRVSQPKGLLPDM